MLEKILFMFFTLAAVIYALGLITKLRDDTIQPTRLVWVAALLVLGGLTTACIILAEMWLESGHPPFQTLYQSTVLFTVTTAAIYLVLARRSHLFGLVTCIFVLAVLAYGVSKGGLGGQTLPPALQSVWFIPHVIVYFLGYGALFLSFVSALLFVLTDLWPTIRSRAAKMLPDRSSLDRFTYKTIVFGFAMISVGLVFGAFWAKYAWGDWWSWDPKENWAAATWLVYGAYLHIRMSSAIGKKSSAWFAIIGFLTLMFTYIGVNYLAVAQQGLHSYAVH